MICIVCQEAPVNTDMGGRLFCTKECRKIYENSQSDIDRARLKYAAITHHDIYWQQFTLGHRVIFR